MGIFLTILKILLIILASILGLVLLIVLLVLFAPIRYKVAGSMHEDISAVAKVRFLIASVLINFSKEAGLKYKVKLLGITFMNSEKPKKKKDKKPKKPKKEEIASQETEVVDEAESSQAADVIEAELADNATLPEINEVEGENNADEVAEEVFPTEEEIKLSKKELKALEKKKKQEEKERKKAEKKAKKDAKEKVSLSEKKDQLVAKLNDTKTKFETKKRHIEELLQKPFTKRTLVRVKKIVIKLFKQILPRKGKGFVHYGLSSPAQTGQITGYLAMALPLYHKWLRLEPDFQENKIEADLNIKGRIHLGMFVIPALCMVIGRDFRRTVKLAKKI